MYFKYTCIVFNDKKEELWSPEDNAYDNETPMQHFRKGGYASSIIEVGGIIIINGKAYIGLNLYQSISFPNPNAPTGRGWQGDEEEVASTTPKAEITTAVESSDEEEEEEEEEEEDEEEEEEEQPDPEPVKPVKKKIVRTKK